MEYICSFCGSWMSLFDTGDLEMNGTLLLRCNCCGETRVIRECDYEPTFKCIDDE